MANAKVERVGGRHQNHLLRLGYPLRHQQERPASGFDDRTRR
jgi:hypothetical protein